MATFVLVPGMWLGGWAWHDVAEALRVAGHRVYPVTLTGLGERVHLGGVPRPCVGRVGLDAIEPRETDAAGVVIGLCVERIAHRVFERHEREAFLGQHREDPIQPIGGERVRVQQ